MILTCLRYIYVVINFDANKISCSAIEMRARQRRIDWVNTQLARRNMEIQDLQTKLHDAEKLLVCSSSSFN